jgi:hypothetical protein
MRSREGVNIDPFIFQDARLYPIGLDETTHISEIRILDNRLKLTIQSQSGVICTGIGGDSGQIVLVDAIGREVGLLVGQPNLLTSLAPGEGVLTFDRRGLPFVATVMSPWPMSNVTGINLADSRLNGDVWIGARDGVVLKRSGQTITLHVVGDKFFRRRQCENEVGEYTAPRLLKKIRVKAHDINSVLYDVGELTPDANGNIFIVAGDGSSDGPGTGVTDNPIRVTQDTNAINLELIGSFD